MQIFTKKDELTEYLDTERISKKSIGFVPTMGSLHEGHLELVRWSVKECDVTVCSIYVNPTQFNDPDDLQNYPINPDKDYQMLERAFCNVVFAPNNYEIYGENQSSLTTLNFGKIETILEGKFRPGHFRGVGIIVTKLLNIVKPDYVYFGQKDLQQFAIVRQLIRDLSYNIRIRCVLIMREPDGLAMSSRNSKLEPENRITAACLYHSLETAKKELLQNVPFAKVKKKTIDFLATQPNVTLEYLEMVDAETFELIDDMKQGTKPAICIAAHVGKVRLIDNLFII